MKKFSVILSAMFLSVLLSGCNSWLIPKNTLNEVTDGDIQNTQFLGINVRSYKEKYEGSVLCYDTSLGLGLYTTRVKEATDYVSYLYLFDANGAKVLFSGSNTYTEGFIDPYDGGIYFKEYNAASLSASVYKTTQEAVSKTTMTKEVVNRVLPWSVGKGILYYVDSDNNLIRTDGISESVDHSFSTDASVRKIVYSPDNNILFYTLVGSQKSSVLYRMDLASYEAGAIDVNVSEFAVNEISNSVVFLKTAGGHDQLYTYNIPTYLRTYLLTGDIDKIAVNYTGSYIAYCTKITTELPSQSIWITTYSGDTASQVTANITLGGNLVFVDTSKLIFSVGTTDSANKETKETVYTIMELDYELDYIKD